MIRTPVPPVTTYLGTHGSELPPVVSGFLDRLRRLPLGAWAEAGRRLEEIDRQERRDRRAGGVAPAGGGVPVRTHLREVVNASPGVAVRARQRVADLAAVAQGFVHPAEVARMKKAALAAALALVARPALGEERFAELYEPFATLIPLASLPDAAAPPRPATTGGRPDAAPPS